MISPASGDDLSASEDVRVKLLNNGTTAQSGFDIQYTIDDGTGALGPFTKTVTETINTGEFLEVTFDEQADLSSPGTEYTIVITSLLTGDENAANDVLTKIVQNTSGVYCYASGSSSTGQEYIANVTIGDISNLSSASQYANYSGDPTLFIYLEPGVASELTITLANPYNADLSAVWIDWNGNGDFYDTGENVYISPMGQGPYVTNITAPDDALHNTNLRMRIRLDYNNPAIDPCGTTSFGEVEDYTVIVSGVQLDPPTNLQYELFEGDINLTWDAPGGKDLPGYNVYYSYNLGNFEVIEYISETSYTFEEPEQGNHRFYITAVYDEGESVASNIVEIVFTGTMENMVDNISIYPNPVLDFATIKFRNSENKVYNLIIRDITGKTVKRKNNITGSKTIIKKGNLKKGIYFIELNGDKIFRSVFIIK
ncbi:MAG: hypothetical protein B6D61_13365 [Bacteroidetes bacterium 4484_249]|nr:MAG: hypothetical protein B6D61_13365 [Bacteroidetes bacterium 4484_249]